MTLFGSKLSVFYLIKIDYLFTKMSCSLRIAAPEFQKKQKEITIKFSKIFEKQTQTVTFSHVFFREFAYFLGTPTYLKEHF